MPTSDRLEITSTVPAQGATEVDPAGLQIDVCFSGLVDPGAIDDFDVVMASGRVTLDTELDLQLVPWRGPGGQPVDPGATEPWCPGSVLSVTPRSTLAPGVLYRIRLRPSAVGWAGEPLDVTQDGWIVEEDGSARFWLEFTLAGRADDGTDTGTGTGSDTDSGTDTADGTGTTGADTGSDSGDDPSDAESSLADLFAPGRILSPDRAACSCHTEPGTLAADLLDLRDPDAAFADLVIDTRVRDTGFPMVSERRPSESFLVHKLLREADGTAIHGVLGDAMPLEGELPYADLVDVITWIEGGAGP